MTISERNRATVLHFCDRLSRRDFSGMAELTTADATWWVVGRPDYASYGGVKHIPDVLKIIEAFMGALDDFSFIVESTMTEGDAVAIEARSSGKRGNAKYNNVYLIRFQLRDGKIHSIREFLDAYEITAYLEQLGVSNSEAFVGTDTGDNG